MKYHIVMSQTEIMRQIIKAGHGPHKAAMLYSTAMEKGLMRKRKSNKRKLSDYDYCHRYLYFIVKGRISGRVSSSNKRKYQRKVAALMRG